MKVTVYERYEEERDGKKVTVDGNHEMHAVDAREAVQNGKGRFSTVPFSNGKVDPKNDPISDELTIKHRGNGSYSVLQGKKEIVEGLTKEEAEKKLEELKAA